MFIIKLPLFLKVMVSQNFRIFKLVRLKLIRLIFHFLWYELLRLIFNSCLTFLWCCRKHSTIITIVIYLVLILLRHKVVYLVKILLVYFLIRLLTFTHSWTVSFVLLIYLVLFWWFILVVFITRVILVNNLWSFYNFHVFFVLLLEFRLIILMMFLGLVLVRIVIILLILILIV